MSLGQVRGEDQLVAPVRFEQRGLNGAASSTHYLGTSTAMAVLARGGNAFDAAVATGFVLQVVEPHLCGPGGDVSAVFVTACDPVPCVLCGQGVAPAAATIHHLRDELGLDHVPSSLVPGRRPRTTLSPSLALRDGEPALAFGTPGGDQQDQWQLCFWLAHTAGGLDLQAAIDAPTWHTTAFPSSFAPRSWQPGGLVVESRLGQHTIVELARRGHRITDAGPWALGRLCAVGRGGQLLRSAVDSRSGVAACAAI